MIDQHQYWSVSIPHELSGPCYTYDPPFDSDPGFDSGVYITMKSAENWDSELEIFLHKKGKLFYMKHYEADTIKIDHLKLKTMASEGPKIKSKQII